MIWVWFCICIAVLWIDMGIATWKVSEAWRKQHQVTIEHRWWHFAACIALGPLWWPLLAFGLDERK